MAQEISDLLRAHLRSTEYLASMCWQRGYLAFKMRPKHHYCWHVAREVRVTQINPNSNHCWSEEKFLGCLKRIACRCHGATVQKRALERYIVALSAYMAKKPA